jgi:hypothetical protein
LRFIGSVLLIAVQSRLYVPPTDVAGPGTHSARLLLRNCGFAWGRWNAAAGEEMQQLFPEGFFSQLQRPFELRYDDVIRALDHPGAGTARPGNGVAVALRADPRTGHRSIVRAVRRRASLRASSRQSIRSGGRNSIGDFAPSLSPPLQVCRRCVSIPTVRKGTVMWIPVPFWRESVYQQRQ